ncbi:hypothetical protein XSR1_50020 [Xenorhabdus szentirmaii DSM 16338]|uniref:Uncharacterized protein n=1 Tax=Xenorhabdus szentirmaii DSM 16338 TaxID=1427518 RepID=W1J1I6_9GAMM|nr:hypothetical protein XSR1_50020 [Xenorhabdus szentirmaii DSM 16338]
MTGVNERSQQRGNLKDEGYSNLNLCYTHKLNAKNVHALVLSIYMAFRAPINLRAVAYR